MLTCRDTVGATEAAVSTKIEPASVACRVGGAKSVQAPTAYSSASTVQFAAGRSTATTLNWPAVNGVVATSKSQNTPLTVGLAVPGEIDEAVAVTGPAFWRTCQSDAAENVNAGETRLSFFHVANRLRREVDSKPPMPTNPPPAAIFSKYH